MAGCTVTCNSAVENVVADINSVLSEPDIPDKENDPSRIRMQRIC